MTPQKRNPRPPPISGTHTHIANLAGDAGHDGVALDRSHLAALDALRQVLVNHVVAATDTRLIARAREHVYIGQAWVRNSGSDENPKKKKNKQTTNNLPSTATQFHGNDQGGTAESATHPPSSLPRVPALMERILLSFSPQQQCYRIEPSKEHYHDHDDLGVQNRMIPSEDFRGCHNLSSIL